MVIRDKGVVMEEKERFELFGEHCIKDNNPDARCQLLDTYKACVILNEQDKENQQLKQQLHDLPKKIVEEIGIKLYSKAMSITGTGVNCVRLYDIENILDAILKKFGGEDE